MVRKRKLRCTIASLLIMLVFTAFCIAVHTAPANAKSAPELSATYVRLAAGGQKTITLKNGRGTWSVEGSGIIKVKKKTKTKITVAPVKSGTAVVSCRTSGKTLTCKVKVLNNRIGSPKKALGFSIVTGKSISVEYTLPKGVTLKSKKYDKTLGKVTTKTSLDKETGKTTVKLKVKALKPGRFTLRLNYLNGSETESEEVNYVFINGFRGKAAYKKTNANYRKWRKKTITSMVTADMTTWEIIDAIGTLIASGDYGNKGGVTGTQLWYGGNGTCISGSKMMDSFMADLGISCKVHFAGNDSSPEDIYGNILYYNSQHRNVRVTLGGKTYELNPQPGFPWPVGTVKR